MNDLTPMMLLDIDDALDRAIDDASAEVRHRVIRQAWAAGERARPPSPSEDAMAAVLALHWKDHDGDCAECWGDRDPQYYRWPCATVRAIHAAGVTP